MGSFTRISVVLDLLSNGRADIVQSLSPSQLQNKKTDNSESCTELNKKKYKNQQNLFPTRFDFYYSTNDKNLKIC